ncbi:hypothetical protein EI982_15790 [Haloplanus rallus]|uniref:Uncharacterized protein n=1 Tax=Haloplanus rallus TaxID=1816183 RepID=A0A6B9F6H9_9EURY|nr:MULTISPECIES: hypothetical protein [Haloplanus]QGX96135.1 hypothetical protein EI982_15790 [Haloplanus rallus]
MSATRPLAPSRSRWARACSPSRAASRTSAARPRRSPPSSATRCRRCTQPWWWESLGVAVLAVAADYRADRGIEAPPLDAVYEE